MDKKIDNLLRAGFEFKASDIHLTVGVPPKMRVNGKLVNMDYPIMYPADTLDVLINIMSEYQRDCFEEFLRFLLRNAHRSLLPLPALRCRGRVGS